MTTQQRTRVKLSRLQGCQILQRVIDLVDKEHATRGYDVASWDLDGAETHMRDAYDKIVQLLESEGLCK